MPRSSRHINLLRAHRKQSALSQDEVAFLLGVQKGSKVSRYEQMTREPRLKTILAYEAIFSCPVAKLFPGLFAKIKAAVQARAKTLGRRAFVGTSKALADQKRKSISKIINQKKNDGEKK